MSAALLLAGCSHEDRADPDTYRLGVMSTDDFDLDAGRTSTCARVSPAPGQQKLMRVARDE